MTRIYTILIALMLVSGCGRQEGKPQLATGNVVESVTKRQVIHDGEPWVEVTIFQRIDPKAPSYVTGIRESISLNRLSWALVEQKFQQQRVITKLRIRPAVTTREMQLNKDDFEWYPHISGFQTIEIALRAEP